ncbi:MAG: CoA transferase [Dehalococcoidia bacterium]|nr:CoA transferase [Dehalococcoidia bacterium]MCB9486898.1 CoA transferase [Thermoflexaceae bacterium]
MTAPLPLNGIRVVDFSIVWAGQSVTMYLADLGAEVIKVENPRIWNPLTRASAARLTPQMCLALPPWLGGHPNNDPGPRPWNNSPAFIHILRNKKSFTVDSRTAEGLTIVQSLVARSDVLVENLPVGTLDKLGLDDATLQSVRPDLVILHQPSFGRHGDYRDGRGYGSHMDAVAGSTILRGYRGTAPLSNVQIVPGDFTAGLHGAVAVLAALRHRRRTGEGQVIEVSQADSSACQFPQAALDAAWNGRASGTLGNRSVEGFVPNGVFPCRAPGDWIAISCRTDEEWAALVRFLGAPAWAEDGALATADGRAQHEDAIELRLADFTAGHDQIKLFHALQDAGVTAGPVLSAAQAANDPHLRATGAWTTLPATDDYPETEWAVPPYRFSESPVGLRTPPCLFGEHNEYVYREVLGLGDEEIEELRAAGHISDTYGLEVLGP